MITNGGGRLDAKNTIFCKSGGCSAKIGPEVLHKVLENLPRKKDEHLLVGFDHSDDAAVYQLTNELAIVQTLDFFPPMVEDPYLFGQIAAANALSDIYAMGGEVKTALNIVCYPEKMDINELGRILEGGNDKVTEAGGILVGGHSIHDQDIKYGLSVTGTIHPEHILKNTGCQIGDKLILTKPLGVGIVTTASRFGEASKEALDMAILSMTTLNKYAAEVIKKYRVTSCTDITGFGFLSHLMEMLEDDRTAVIESDQIPYIKESYDYALEFFLTGAAQRNRNYLEHKILFECTDFAMEELLFDPQTSGGLLFSIKSEDAILALNDLKKLNLPCNIVGEITGATDVKIRVH